MKKALIGSFLALGLFVSGTQTFAADYSASDLKAKLTSHDDQAADIWDRLNDAMDYAEAHDIDIAPAAALKDEAQVQYDALHGDTMDLVALIDDESSTMTEKRAKLAEIKADFEAWKETMLSIHDHLVSAYEHHTEDEE